MAEKTAAALADHLKKTGTGHGRVASLREWIAAESGRLGEGDELSAETALEHMEQDLGTYQEGTVLKAGRFVRGDGYGLNRPGETTQDELVRLRSEAENLKRTVRELSGKNEVLNRTTRAQEEKLKGVTDKDAEIDTLRKREADLREENDALKNELKDLTDKGVELETLREENESLRAEIDTLKNEINDSEDKDAELETLREENESLREKVESLEDEILSGKSEQGPKGKPGNKKS